ncbi:MAG: TlpA disulfide reductase family protein [Micromonosporaceae bacterium]
MSRARVAVVAVALLAALAGCTADERPGAEGSAAAGAPRVIPTGTCLPAPSPSASPSGDPGASAYGVLDAPPAGDRRPLPDLALPCLDGSGTVELSWIGRPAVINLWASWCQPCLVELPAFQRYAERAAGQITVIGVDTADIRDSGRETAHKLGLTFPNLYDSQSQLRDALDGKPLPVTLFVDADGSIAHLYNGKALDEATLDELVQQYLGVVVPE